MKLFRSSWRLVPRRAWLLPLALLLLGSDPAAAAGDAAKSPGLQVCLLSGCDEPAYNTDESLGKLKVSLESAFGFRCELVRWAPGHHTFEDMAALERADAVVIFVRRMEADADTLAAVHRLLARGVGVVGLRTASHAWETWPKFDVDVLGASYGRHGGKAQRITFPEPDHPILTQVAGFSTEGDIYKYELKRPAPGLDVLIEGKTAKGEYPVAWTTQFDQSRIFYVGLGANEEFVKPGFLRMIGNALFWTTHHPVPGARLQIERTIMPDADPSAFAIGFSNGVNCCYDPVRGGMNYIWEGGFVDVTSVRPGMGKSIKPVALLGTVRYREKGKTPLRHGDPTRVPEVVFKGYRLLGNAIEFSCDVDGVRVRERVEPRADGKGLIRTFHPDPVAGAGPWWYLPGQVEGAPVQAVGGQADQGGYRFDPAGDSGFTLEVAFGGSQS